MLTSDEKFQLIIYSIIAIVLCLQSILVIFKLTGMIDWNWIFIMLPLVIFCTIVGLYALFMLILAIIGIFD